MRRLLLLLLAALLVASPADAAKKKKGKKGKRAKTTQTQPKKRKEPYKPLPTVAEQPRIVETPPPQPEVFVDTQKLKLMTVRFSGSAGVDPVFIDGLTQAVSETLAQMGPFAVASSTDVQRIVEHAATRQMLGCSDPSCLAELGTASGADYLVTGSVTLAGDVHVLQLQLLRVDAARVDGRVSRPYQGPSDGLFDEARAAAKLLVRDVLAERQGQLAIVVKEEGASITIDGALMGVSPLREPATLAEGLHRLEVEKQGFIVSREDVMVEREKQLTHRVTLLPSDEWKRDYANHARFVRRAAYVTLGTGIAALGGGAALFFVGRQKADELNRDVAAYNGNDVRPATIQDDLDKRERTVATLDVLTLVAAGVGVACITTSIVLWSRGDDPDRYEIVPSTRVVKASPPLRLVSGRSELGTQTLGLQLRF
ncbi:MAG: PEGA domain-containing protein [Myxococcota bacterium]